MKFTIRDLFLVTLIVALAVGWLIEHRGRIEKAEHAENAQATAEFLAELLNERGYQIIVHPNGALSDRVSSDSSEPAPNPPKN